MISLREETRPEGQTEHSETTSEARLISLREETRPWGLRPGQTRAQNGVSELLTASVSSAQETLSKNTKPEYSETQDDTDEMDDRHEEQSTWCAMRDKANGAEVDEQVDAFGLNLSR